MILKKKPTLTDIVYYCSILYHLIIGIFVLIISNRNLDDKIILLGVLIILSSVPHILIYFINKTKKTYLLIGLVGLAFGILFLSTDLFTDDQICMVWGCLDICRGLTEIATIVPEAKNNKFEIVEIFISTGDIVIGILLCIHLANGLHLHLLYLGIAFLITVLKDIVELIVVNTNAKRVNNN